MGNNNLNQQNIYVGYNVISRLKIYAPEITPDSPNIFILIGITSRFYKNVLMFTNLLYLALQNNDIPTYIYQYTKFITWFRVINYYSFVFILYYEKRNNFFLPGASPNIRVNL